MNSRLVEVLSALSLVVSITGCATTQSFMANMNAYKGKNSNELIHEFGQPDQRTEKDGQTVLVFRPITANIPIPTPSLGTGMDAVYISPHASSSYNIRANCQVAFILVKDQVTDWYSQGKDCPSR